MPRPIAIPRPQPVVALLPALALCALCACGDPAVAVQEAADSGAPVDPTEATQALEPVVRTSADGLVVSVSERGSGPRAGLGDRILLHYRGTLAESGEEFRSTWTRGVPTEVVLGRNELIRGLERALLGLRAGARAAVDVPAALAYGEDGVGAIPPGADLHFELELVSIRSGKR